MTAPQTRTSQHPATNGRSASAAMASLPLMVSLALAGACPGAWAQASSPSYNTNAGAKGGGAGVPADPTGATGPARNNYGDMLKSTKRSSAKKNNTPYEPIKKQEDAGQMPEIEMFVGESRVFPTPGVARIAVGNGQIMSAAALDDKEVIIFANGIGTSSLFVWNEDGRYQRVKVNIVPGDTSRIAREVAAFLSTIPNTKASIVGDKVIVEGDTLSDEDREKVVELAKRYPQIVNFTSVIGWEKMVMMDVKVVEFPKSELREMGLKWGASGGAALGAVWQPFRLANSGAYQSTIPTNGDGLPVTDQGSSNAKGGVTLPSTLNILSGLDLGITAKLNLLEQNGKASVLAEPQLSARSGFKASFLAGGEFPYSVATSTGVTIQFKPYGIKLDIEPKIGRDGVIRAVIDSEVSSLDASVTTISGPAILTRRTKTEFNVRNGETMILSGLLQRTTSNDIDKVPLLGDIPILGALFRSKRFQNKETELVVFVTPTIVDSHSPGMRERIERTTERLTENLGKAPFLTAPLQPGRDAASFDLGRAEASVAPLTGALAPQPLGRAAPITAPQDAPLTPAAHNPLQWPQASTPVAGGASLQVKRDGLVLRAQANDASAALLELGYNSVVLLGRAEPQPPGRALWRNVVVGQLNGWVRADALQPSRLSPVLLTRTPSAVAHNAQEGAPLTLGVDNGPGVRAGAPNVVTPEQPNGDAPRQYRVVLEGLALHVSPDINALTVQPLEQGQLVDALPQPASGNWVAVRSGAARGWVAAQWLHAVPATN